MLKTAAALGGPAPDVGTRQPVLCFVGLTTLDVVHRGVAAPGRNQKVTASWQSVAAGGPAANAAVVAARLGATVTLLTALGPDPVAGLARRELESHGVRVLDVIGPDSEAGFQFPVSSVLVDAATGERTVVSLDGGGRFDCGARLDSGGGQCGGGSHDGGCLPDGGGRDLLASLPAGISPRVALALADAIRHSDAILLDGHYPDLARLALNLTEGAARAPLVILDGGRWRPIFAELLPRADVAALSADFELPPGLPGPRMVTVTDGANPVRWTQDRGNGQVSRGQVPVPQVAVVDTLGAGDAWHGALAYHLAAGHALEAAIAAANQVAAIRVQQLGNREWLDAVPVPHVPGSH